MLSRIFDLWFRFEDKLNMKNRKHIVINSDSRNEDLDSKKQRNNTKTFQGEFTEGVWAVNIPKI